MVKAAALIALFIPAIAAAAPCVEAAKTTAAVACVEDHWERAFIGGDSAVLNALLTDTFQSYAGDGTVHDKAAIVKIASDHAKAHPNEPVTPPPVHADIQLRGDVAVVFWKNPDGSLASVDAFAWSDGHWRAWYSQHAATKKS
ncbi:MAG TPA: nuclear transport factor 2 family protein [Kofleriaceae bacterium]|jgi:hypothetical protein